MGAASDTRCRLPPIRWRRTPASAPRHPFNRPREARSAVGWRLAIAGHPCAPGAGAATGPASARVNGHGRQFGPGVVQPDYASPPAFRLVWSCCPLGCGDPKGNILRVSSAIGFKPHGPTKAAAAHLLYLQPLARAEPQKLDPARLSVRTSASFSPRSGWWGSYSPTSGARSVVRSRVTPVK